MCLSFSLSSDQPCEPPKPCVPNFTNFSNNHDIRNILRLLSSNNVDSFKLGVELVKQFAVQGVIFCMANCAFIVDDSTIDFPMNPYEAATIELRSKVVGEVPKSNRWQGQRNAKLIEYNNITNEVYLIANHLHNQSLSWYSQSVAGVFMDFEGQMLVCTDSLEKRQLS